MRTRATVSLIAAGLILGLTGCNSNVPEASDKPGDRETTPSAAKSPATKPKSDAPLKLRAGTHWSDTDNDGSHISGTTTALSYIQPATGVDLPNEAADFKNPTWAVLEVKVCADDSSTSVLVAQDPWALGFADDTRLDAPSLSGSGVPKPEYPTGNGALVRAGTCLRGKITFSLEHGTRPATVIYAPMGRDPIEWAVPKV
ncbi:MULTISPECIES: hypothetical protein [unclassified Streptomyces]|uniref:hypothetical protein n=1 Tax=unclassified Streptomyces TaxID=2593676 RepID=UPI000DB97C77|nr:MULTISPECIES: hypothetical protein [unclassified Streptomyces]MYT68151.1 hypothetical protein [Streptomyces sp. SID8367]RAJ72717.1 hypothetical protein K377_07271 [Streptomyces sp. PsTaAH-137]